MIKSFSVISYRLSVVSFLLSMVLLDKLEGYYYSYCHPEEDVVRHGSHVETDPNFQDLEISLRPGWVEMTDEDVVRRYP